MAKPVRWGILGTGNIAKQFAEGLTCLPDAELTAVGSRARETAEGFAGQFGVPHPHASYEDLARDPDVDAIYVATPHPFHKECSVLCLRAGKAVLCEKPFTVNAREAEEVIGVAREAKVFLMEAMWTRFIPLTGKVREWLVEGRIGEVRMLSADFGFRGGWRPEGRLLNPALAGGALLDVGVYTVSFASMVFGGEPSRIAALAHMGETGVDEQSAMVLGYDGGGLAVLSCAVRTRTAGEVRIYGTDGSVLIHPPFWQPSAATLIAGGKEERVEIPFEGNGFNYEAAEVARCLREGKLESGIMPLDESLSIIKTLDRIREGWGLRYPME